MFNYIRKIFSNDDYKRIIDNIISLFGLQGFNYLMPLITFPYLTRVLGPDNYGLLAFALAFIGYFQILTDYGFNLSATRAISINRNDNSKVSEIYSSVMVSKAILMIISFCLMTFIVSSFDKFRNDWLLYFFTFGLVFGNLLLPTWFFQGMEKMRYISILNICIGLIYTIFLFIFVRNKSDYIYVPLINSMGTIIVGLYALSLVHREFNIKFCKPSMESIKNQLKDGWHLFISNMAISLYTTSNRFILGFFVSNYILGYYAVAETIVKALQGLISPISQAIYPYISKLQSENKQKAIKQFKKILMLIGLLSFLISVLLVFCSPLLVELLAGSAYTSSIPLLQVMVFIVFAVGVNNILGIQGLVAFGYQKKFTKIVIFTGIIHIFLLIFLIVILGAMGAAITVVITELIICLLMYLSLRRLKIL
ncbi:MAG: flippase [Methanobacteriaceae archaeon]|nr:flippase [Methanobacteriaceae archaeon]